MPLMRLQIWNVGCDYADAGGRHCWTSRNERGCSRLEALERSRAAGWSITRRQGRTEVRCPEHRRMHTHPGGLVGRLRAQGLSIADAEAVASDEGGQGSEIGGADDAAASPLTARSTRPEDAQKQGDGGSPRGPRPPSSERSGTPDRPPMESDFTELPPVEPSPPPSKRPPGRGSGVKRGSGPRRGAKRRHGRSRGTGGGN
jgi:hypothetical protein